MLLSSNDANEKGATPYIFSTYFVEASEKDRVILKKIIFIEIKG